MKIVLLDGTYGDHCIEARKKLESQYHAEGHEVQVFKLEDMNIAYCIGCWSCWHKTPGRCIHQDDTQLLLGEVINSDMVIHFTENSMGFATSLTKKMLDKFVPLVHPYITLDQGECHHVRRYETYPTFGLVYIDDEGNEGDYQTTKDIFARAALNFKSSLALSIHLNHTGEAI